MSALAGCVPRSVVMAVCVALASSCASRSARPTGLAPALARDTATSDLRVPDATLEKVLAGELAADRAFVHPTIGITSRRGIVTLAGTVDSQWAKARAVELARVVRGVRAVVDRIDVLQRARPDYELDATVAYEVSRDPAIAEGERIVPHARDGVVNLTGLVDSAGARVVAERDVLRIQGVRSVTNHLEVSPHRREPGSVEALAKRLLRDDPWLGDMDVRVRVDDDALHLAGFVAGPRQWARARVDASLASSLVSVDMSSLSVDRGADDGTTREGPVAGRSDGDIGQALLDACVVDPRVPPFVPTVDVVAGVVVLTGVAPNPRAAFAVADDARNVVGAAAVHDDLKTVPTVYEQSDDSIAAQIRRTLAADPRLARASIDVDVRRGRVFLRGTVADAPDRVRAIDLAMIPPGARDVFDGLAVTAWPPGAASAQPQ